MTNRREYRNLLGKILHDTRIGIHQMIMDLLDSDFASPQIGLPHIFVEFLLHHDCLPNLLDDVELTALDHALHLGNEECVALLVACGAEKSGHAPSIVHSPSVPAHRKKKRPLTQENKAANKHSLLSKSLGEIDLGNVPSPSRRHAVVFRNMSPAPSPDQAPSSPAVDFAPRPISLGDEELQVSPKIPQHKYKSRLRQSSTEPGTTDDDDDGDDADKE